MTRLLVVAGEASGDGAAAAVIARLDGAHVFGLGGPALARAGVDLVADLRASTALGIGEAAARARSVLRTWRAVVRASQKRRPRAALLVDYTEFNARLAPRLHRAGVRVLWYGAPQVWAWRPNRIHGLKRWIDRMAVILPFEESIWREAGVDAHYVGHPALEKTTLDRESARRALDMTPFAAAVALLPGSRPHEVRRLIAPMLDAYERVRADRASVDARVLVAASLDGSTRDWVRALCASHHVPTFDVDPWVGAIDVLRAFEVALCASGTVTVEAVVARAIPVVTYRVGLATALAVGLFVRTPHVALPNVLLGRRAFAELVQRDAVAEQMAGAVSDALDRRDELVAACGEVESRLGSAHRPSVAVARMLAPWLGVRVRGV